MKKIKISLMVGFLVAASNLKPMESGAAYGDRSPVVIVEPQNENPADVRARTGMSATTPVRSQTPPGDWSSYGVVSTPSTGADWNPSQYAVSGQGGVIPPAYEVMPDAAASTPVFYEPVASQSSASTPPSDSSWEGYLPGFEISFPQATYDDLFGAEQPKAGGFKDSVLREVKALTADLNRALSTVTAQVDSKAVQAEVTAYENSLKDLKRALDDGDAGKTFLGRTRSVENQKTVNSVVAALKMRKQNVDDLLSQDKTGAQQGVVVLPSQAGSSSSLTANIQQVTLPGSQPQQPAQQKRFTVDDNGIVVPIRSNDFNKRIFDVNPDGTVTPRKQ